MGKWTDYLKGSNSKHVISLDEIGLDFSITVRNMSVYTPVQVHDMINTANKIAIDRLQVKNEAYKVASEDLKEKVEAKEMTEDEMYLELDSLAYSEPIGLTSIHHMLILEWNLTDPETEEVFEIPSENPDVLFRIPVGVQTYIRTKLDAYIDDPESIIPKESATS